MKRMLALLTTLVLAPIAAVQQAQPPQATPAAAPALDPEIANKLLSLRRICVEISGDDKTSKQLEAMVINALNESKKFIITENCAKADAKLKGVATEQVHQEAHSASESVGVGTQGATANMSDSSHATETIFDVHLAVRLVAQDGDVIWSTTQESNGAKYKGAGPDAADKVVKHLIWDIEALQKLRDTSKKN
jgi:hypothetical protein